MNCSAFFVTFLTKRLHRYGADAMVLVSTVGIVTLSIIFTVLSLLIFQGSVDFLGIAICTAAPILIFPLPARLFFKTFLKLQKTEEVLHRRNEELEQALGEVKTLSGLLPVCCSCKKVRDDEGYWKEVEQYICNKFDLTLTHGFCPDCIARLYPEYAKTKAERHIRPASDV